MPADTIHAMDETLTGGLRHRIGQSMYAFAVRYGTPVDYSTHSDAVINNDRIFRLKSKLIRELGDGLSITDLATYDTVYTQSRAIDAAALIEAGEIDFCVFTSASTVRGFAGGVPGVDFSKVNAETAGS